MCKYESMFDEAAIDAPDAVQVTNVSDWGGSCLVLKASRWSLVGVNSAAGIRDANRLEMAYFQARLWYSITLFACNKRDLGECDPADS
ncbi:MAG: hypothetical protein R3E64_17905 [Halioglobus sp.]